MQLPSWMMKLDWLAKKHPILAILAFVVYSLAWAVAGAFGMAKMA